MTPRRSLLLVPALACGLAAQAPPSVALPPELDRVLRDYERAWSAKDPEALARLFTAEGMALPSGQPPAQGAASIRQAYAQHAGSPLALRALAYATSGDLAYIIGGFAPAPGQPDLGRSRSRPCRRCCSCWCSAAAPVGAGSSPPTWTTRTSGAPPHRHPAGRTDPGLLLVGWKSPKPVRTTTRSAHEPSQRPPPAPGRPAQGPA